MTFTSIAFVIFFLIIVPAYYICPPRFRWALLLGASCYFYMAFIPKYILVLFALILVDYTAAIQIEKSNADGNTKRKKFFFLLSIFSTICILFVFKYFNFFNENIAVMAKFFHWNYSIGSLSLLLPLGLSFHTFQSLSYVIEVYRGNYKAERHLGIYSLYVLFFPQLVAGPIERPEHLLPQLKTMHTFNWQRTFSGVRLMGWGFFKKLIIADRLAASVTYVYGHIDQSAGPGILMTAVFFAFQLYADFSGYSDIARGSAKVLGIDVVNNFAQPYFSRSIAEFWRRWHISLSTWFRDYFYYPLMSRGRIKVSWIYFCVIATFAATGLWHGAGWTFLTMGLIFGCSIVLGMVTKKWREKIVTVTGLSRLPYLRSFLQIIFTFLLVSFSWTFFRAPNIPTALNFLKHLFVGWNISPELLFKNYFLIPFDTLGLSRGDLIIAISAILILLGVEWLQTKKSAGLFLDNLHVFPRALIYSGLAISIFIFSVYVTEQFIYFQF